MLRSQELQMSMSRARQRLGELFDVEERNEDEQGELQTLTEQLQSEEAEYRAALASEATETAEAEAEREARAAADGTTETGLSAEDREVRALQDGSRLGRFVSAFAQGDRLDGTEKELMEHRGLDPLGRTIPWDMLLPPPGRSDPWGSPPAGVLRDEHRADAVTPSPATGNPVEQSEILQRVFARSAVALLGVDMPMVGVGQASYPVIASGQTPEYPGADGVKEAEAGAITPHVLGPKRLTGRFTYRLEDELTTLGLESALRRDLRASLVDAQAQQLTGPGSAEVRGFLAAAAAGGLPAAAAPGAAVVDFPTAAGVAATGVDGRYAGSEMELVWVVGVRTYQVLAGVFAEDGEVSATERLRRMLRGWMASAHIPAAVKNIQEGILAKVGAVTRTAVCPVWEGIRLITDQVTAATTGRVNVTAIAMHNFALLRPDAFVRTALRLKAGDN